MGPSTPRWHGPHVLHCPQYQGPTAGSGQCRSSDCKAGHQEKLLGDLPRLTVPALMGTLAPLRDCQSTVQLPKPHQVLSTSHALGPSLSTVCRISIDSWICIQIWLRKPWQSLFLLIRTLSLLAWSTDCKRSCRNPTVHSPLRISHCKAVPHDVPHSKWQVAVSPIS
jgi:hypothetical protein